MVISLFSMRNLLLFLLLLLPLSVKAVETESFRMTGHAVHVEAPRAEVCMTFNRQIAIEDRANIAETIRLERDGVKTAIDPQDLSLTSSEICVQQLKHRHRYHLVADDIVDDKGEPLDDGVNISFLVPDRKPFLSFVTVGTNEIMPRYIKASEKDRVVKAAKNPQIGLKAINVAATRLTLYRIGERKQFPAAWEQFKQLNLAPTESQYFASHNGQQIWQSELVFSANPNIEQNIDVPLPSNNDLVPGLYFLAAAPKAEGAIPGLFAGLWFLVSDLKLTAVTSADGIYVFAFNAATMRPEPEVDLQLLARDGTLLAEGKSNTEGIARLVPEKDRETVAALVTGLAAQGNVGLLDLARLSDGAFVPLGHVALMTTDRKAYQAGSTATVTLFARDENGRAQKIGNSTLKLLRPDHSFYSEQQVPGDKQGVITLSVSLPYVRSTGEWTLLWQSSAGSTLAQSKVRIMTKTGETKLEAFADRSLIEPDGTIALTVKATNGAAKPLAWHTGYVEARQSLPEFPGQKNYHFGTTSNYDKTRTVKFITSAEGTALVHLHIPLEGSREAARAITFLVNLDGAADPVTVSVPVRPSSGWVGIRALQGNRPFAENNIATFDIMAIDPDGKRRAWNDLYFQIYEEGRSFKWFPAEGYWDYKPLPRHRRIGGGRISLAANGENIIRWPVTAGHYVLEITTNDGVVLSQYGFDAGLSALSVNNVSNNNILYLASQQPLLEPKRDNRLKIKLNEPGIINIVIGDNLIRQTIHRFMPKGENVITVVPSEEWGKEVQIRAHAFFADGDQAVSRLTLPLRHTQQELELSVKQPLSILTGTRFSLPVSVQKIAKQKATFVTAVATPVHIDGTTNLSSVTSTAVPIDTDGRAQLHFGLPEFSGSLKLALSAWNDDQYAAKTVSLPVQPALIVAPDVPGPLTIGDRVSLTLGLENKGIADGSYNYVFRLPKGINPNDMVKGTVTLKRNQGRVLSIDLAPIREVEGLIHFDMAGPNNFKLSHSWPISVRNDPRAPRYLTPYKLEPKQAVNLPLNPVARGDKSFALVGPVPLTEVWNSLQVLLSTETVSTEDLARWLIVTRVWKNEIVTFGLMGEMRLQQAREMRLRQLQQRQNDDGGFSSALSQKESDLSSTAAALNALRDEASFPARMAAKWLQRRLENTWFEETERSLRASCFLALSSAGQVDLSALRYFADTSRDKKLGPVAAGQIALALAQSKDEEAARYWLHQALPLLTTLIETKAVETSPLFEALMANTQLNPRDIKVEFEKAATADLPANPGMAGSFLLGLKSYMQRAGSFSFGINKAVQKKEAIYHLSLPEKGAALTLNNPSDDNLYALQVQEVRNKQNAEKKEEATVTVQREIYQLDGKALAEDDPLVHGQVYIVSLRGTGKRNETRFITQALHVGLQPLAVAQEEAASFAAAWPWLPKPPSFVENTSTLADEIGFLLRPAHDWQVFYLVKAVRKGLYYLPSVTLRDPAGTILNVTQNRRRIEIR